MSKQEQLPYLSTTSLGKRVPSPEGELIILDDINLSVAPGESLAIVGASGSGKSTLLGLMAGLDTASHGSVFLDGQDLGTLDEDGRAALRASRVGFVFQSFQLLPSVMLPLELGGRSDPRHGAEIILDRVGLADRVQHYPKQLSGGEQQRVAIARAYAGEPRILFADEPTGNLDRKTGERIGELLFTLNHEHGTTLVLVTHDVRLAERCDRVVELDGGKIVNGVSS
jgi:putative ABC transport system ATP-binding protein